MHTIRLFLFIGIIKHTDMITKSQQTINVESESDTGFLILFYCSFILFLKTAKASTLILRHLLLQLPRYSYYSTLQLYLQFNSDKRLYSQIIFFLNKHLHDFLLSYNFTRRKYWIHENLRAFDIKFTYLIDLYV